MNKKVYLHDTDSTGVVYYSKYLDWFEEARMEMLEEKYKSLNSIINEDKVTFFPIECNIKYKKTLALGDTCSISVIPKLSNSISVTLEYTVTSNNELITEANIKMLCVSIDKKRPAKLPIKLREIIEQWI